MPKKSLTTLIACAILATTIAGGCQQKVYVGGIGGNLVEVKQPDGTTVLVPVDEVESENAKSTSPKNNTREKQGIVGEILKAGMSWEETCAALDVKESEMQPTVMKGEWAWYYCKSKRFPNAVLTLKFRLDPIVFGQPATIAGLDSWKLKSRSQ